MKPNPNVEYEIMYSDNGRGKDVAMFNMKNKDNLVIFFHGNNDQLSNGPSLFTKEFEEYAPDYSFLGLEYPNRGLSVYPEGYIYNMEDMNKT